jgi:murein DD-endopeptidase MepM/ murein hydrolase activator NlpD
VNMTVPTTRPNAVYYPVDLAQSRVIVPFLGNWTLGTYRKGYGWHTGLDFIGKAANRGLGTKVRAIADGVVLDSSAPVSPRGYGNMVYIQHPALGVWTRSAHLSTRLVKTGDTVKAGQVIGLMGTSGTDNVHLHFDIATQAFGWDREFHAADTAIAKAYVEAHFTDPTNFFLRHVALSLPESAA